MRVARFPLCQVALLCCAQYFAAASPLEIEWGKGIELGRGTYARMHRLADGRFMVAYQSGDGVVARFAGPGNLRVWSEPVQVAADFTKDAGGCAPQTPPEITVHLANAEFAQLESGRIIYACNLRPDGQRHDIHPYAIATTTSDDGGKTWSPLKTVYRAEVKLAPDGQHHGCYEPFILPLGRNKAQLYFADESPYEAAGCAWQNITFVETTDGGRTWSKPRIAAYTPQCRDGMPSLLELGKWRYLALESNPGLTHLHPQIVKCRRGAGWDGAMRFEPFSPPPDWRTVYAGAPYIAATENYVLLSWQEVRPSSTNGAIKTAARVAAVPKSEILPDGTWPAMHGAATPPETGGMLWNSLCTLGGDCFMLVSEVEGRIMAYPGRIAET